MGWNFFRPFNSFFILTVKVPVKELVFTKPGSKRIFRYAPGDASGKPGRESHISLLTAYNKFFICHAVKLVYLILNYQINFFNKNPL
jgi:hypothetical protein